MRRLMNRTAAVGLSVTLALGAAAAPCAADETTAGKAPSISKYSTSGRDALLAESVDRTALASRGLGYEKLDQLTMEVLMGVR